MGIRSYRINFRTRGGIDPNLWNQFWTNLWYDLQDVIGSGLEPFLSEDLGTPDFLSKYDIAVSGMAGKEDNE
jgi:hypothetical protein